MSMHACVYAYVCVYTHACRYVGPPVTLPPVSLSLRLPHRPLPDTYRDVSALLVSTPKGVISMTDATGICCFLPTSPHATSDSAASGKKATKFVRPIALLHVNLLVCTKSLCTNDCRWMRR